MSKDTEVVDIKVELPKCPDCRNDDPARIVRLWRDNKKVAEYGFSPDFHCRQCGFEWMISRSTKAERLRDLHEALKELRGETGDTTGLYL